MRTLIAEDDFVSRNVLHRLISPFGPCDIAVDGIEAVEASRLAHEENKSYDLVCLDIMMPGMDGHEVLKEMRRLEADRGIRGLSGAKIIMTTALGDPDSIKKAFKEQCEAYLIKPVEKEKLYSHISSFGLAGMEE